MSESSRSFCKYPLPRPEPAPRKGACPPPPHGEGPAPAEAGTGPAWRKSPADFPAKLRKISKLVTQVPKFCDSDAKENPDGFLSHYLSLRILWPERFFDKLNFYSATGPLLSKAFRTVTGAYSFWKINPSVRTFWGWGASPRPFSVIQKIPCPVQ